MLRVRVVAIAVVCAIATACSSTAGQPSSTPVGRSHPASTAPATAPAPRGPAAVALRQLAVKGRAAKTGYERSAFGARWADVDHNGCDTRNDILNRDLTDKEWRPGTNDCVVVAGDLAEPYGGTTVHFLKADAIAVQIDHVVALSNAWQTGAAGWDEERRRAFANDPLNLLAVSGPLNEAKGDGDAATWLPPNRAEWCPYVARQIAVKRKWGLWITAAERDAMARVLARCPNQVLP